MSALRQYDGFHAESLRSGTLLGRRLGPAYYPADDTPIPNGRYFYGLPGVEYMTCIRSSASGVFVVDSGLNRYRTYEPDHAERITRDLERLTDGWYGPGSKAPGQSVVRDLGTVLSQLNTGDAKPETEIDEDTGNVTVRWFSADDNVTLAMVFNGDARVVVIETVVGQETISASKVFLVEDLSGITRFLIGGKAHGEIFETS